jgi:hypothetical protein
LLPDILQSAASPNKDELGKVKKKGGGTSFGQKLQFLLHLPGQGKTILWLSLSPTKK